MCWWWSIGPLARCVGYHEMSTDLPTHLEEDGPQPATALTTRHLPTVRACENIGCSPGWRCKDSRRPLSVAQEVQYPLHEEGGGLFVV
jgi:hypothetical protein